MAAICSIYGHVVLMVVAIDSVVVLVIMVAVRSGYVVLLVLVAGDAVVCCVVASADYVLRSVWHSRLLACLSKIPRESEKKLSRSGF